MLYDIKNLIVVLDIGISMDIVYNEQEIVE